MALDEYERTRIANLMLGAAILGFILWMASCSAPATNPDGSAKPGVTVGEDLGESLEAATPAIASGLGAINPLLGLLAIPFLGAGAAALKGKKKPDAPG